MKEKTKIHFPYSKPYIDKKDIKAVYEVLTNGYLTQGQRLTDFEKLLKKTFKSNYALACNSGTAALHMIYRALNVGPEKSVLTTPITFLSTANAAKMCGAKVYFSDVDKKTGCMDPNSAEQILKKYPNISVIVVVHLCGRVENVEEISKLAKKYNCKLVEDACHAPGSSFKNKKGETVFTGSCKYSVASSFSFHAIKHIAVGEGGCITTNNSSIFKKIKNYRSHGMIRGNINKWEYKMYDLGWNYRLDEISCALGISQISKLTKGIEKRRELVKTYKSYLEEYEYINLPDEPEFTNSHSWHLFSIQIDFINLNKNRLKVMKKLSSFGVGTQIHYKPIFLQPYYSNNLQKKNALEYYNKTLSLPLYPELKKKEVKFICETLIKVLGLK